MVYDSSCILILYPEMHRKSDIGCANVGTYLLALNDGTTHSICKRNMSMMYYYKPLYSGIPIHEIIPGCHRIKYMQYVSL